MVDVYTIFMKCLMIIFFQLQKHNSWYYLYNVKKNEINENTKI